MLDRTGNAEQFDAFFAASGVGKTGLTVAVDVWGPTGTALVTGGAAAEVGGGFYTYALADTNTATEGNYRAVFRTVDGTVDQKQIPSLWVVGKPWVQDVDAAVSSRGTSNFAGGAVASVAAPVTVGTNDDKAGYGLADGAITSAKFGAITAGLAGFLERLALLTHRTYPVAGGSVTHPKSGTGNQVVKGAGGSVLATIPVSDDGTTQTLGAAG